MPLKINVGVSRKVSQDYQSTGFSLNIDAELPANLIDNPDAMAEQSSHLFQLANDLLDEQVRQAGGKAPVSSNPPRRPAPSSTNGTNGNGHKPYRNGNTSPKTNGNGHTNHHGNGRGDRGITDAQVRAVGNMAKRLGTDGETYAIDNTGNTLSELSVKEASQLIDQLKGELEKQPAGAGR